jgi:hypothetical protein
MAIRQILTLKFVLFGRAAWVRPGGALLRVQHRFPAAPMKRSLDFALDCVAVERTGSKPFLRTQSGPLSELFQDLLAILYSV